MEYIFYKVSIVEYQNPNYESGPTLTTQDDPTRDEVMELLEIQQPNYFENLEGLYNNKHVIRVNEIGVGYTYWMLTPISIAYQTERIQMAKASIRTSINNKGGTITTEERLDKFAGYIDNIQGAKTEEEKTVSTPSFASGNIVVEPTTNKVMKKVTINKDTTNHIGENIKDGITLYGIQGSLQPAKTEQEKTVSNPNFSAGNVVVTPDANKVLSKATVKKDANLVAGNIKDGVTLFGVTGDYEGAPVGYSVTFNYFDDVSGTEYITIYTIEDGVTKNYTFKNKTGINLNLANVTYITAFRNDSSGPQELPYHTITGATTAELLNGLIPTQNISFSRYLKD